MKGEWNYVPTHNAYIIASFSCILYTLFPGTAVLGYAFFDLGLVLTVLSGFLWGLLWGFSKRKPVTHMETLPGSMFITIAGRTSPTNAHPSGTALGSLTGILANYLNLSHLQFAILLQFLFLAFATGVPFMHLWNN
jgi:hypothetical protein